MGSYFYEMVGVITAVLFFIWLFFKIAKGIWTCWLGAMVKSSPWRPSPDTWAVVTGATDGIGLAYAKELARMGYNLCLISRNRDKLEKTKEEIQAQYKKCSNIRIISADFGSKDVYADIDSQLADIGDIHVLVNNVGISYEYPEYFTKIPNAKLLMESMVNCNLYSVMGMCQIVLPRMEAKRRGIIINLSSYSANFPNPLLAMYSASKVFVDYFSRALQLEYEDKNIIIQAVLPAFVTTKMSKIRRASLLVPTPSAYVRAALKTVGLEDRTYGYWSHKLMGFVQDSIVSPLMGPGANARLGFNVLKNDRFRYYKKNGIKTD